MTVVVSNASAPFVRALREMAKLDGASISVEKEERYPRSLVASVLKADKEIERERRRGTLKTYGSVDEMFSEL